MPARRVVLGVLAVVTLCWLPTLGFEFVYDDHWTLIGNGFLRNPGDAWLLLGPHAIAQHVPDAFRPVSVLFDIASYQLVGLSAPAHHAISVALVVATAALLERWLGGLRVAFAQRVCATAVFGVMAIHAEAIAVVSFREDLLAAGLGLAALAAADAGLDATGPRRAGAWTGAWLCMVLAAGSKLSAAPLPLVWWLARARLRPDDDRARRLGRVACAALLASAVALIVAHRLHVIGGVSPYGDSSRVFAYRAGWSAVWAASTQIHLGYLQQMLVPWGLQPEYVDYGARWTDPATVLATGALLGLLGVGLAAWRRAPIVAVAILAALLLALPTSNLAPMPNMRAERFMLLPSVPVSLGLGALLVTAGRRLVPRLGHPGWEIAPVCAFVIVQGALARAAAATYASDNRLWDIAVRHAPHSARAQAIVGELRVARMVRDPRAIDNPRLSALARSHCQIAVRRDPLDDLGHLCEARLASAEQRWTDAHHAFAEALARGGVRADRALVALASTSLDRPEIPYAERQERAFAYLDRAQREYPYAAEVAVQTARTHHRLGRADVAQAAYARASQLAPERWDVVLGGVELLLDLGDASAARTKLTAAKRRLDHADDPTLLALHRRLTDAERLFPSTQPWLPPAPQRSPRSDEP